MPTRFRRRCAPSPTTSRILLIRAIGEIRGSLTLCAFASDFESLGGIIMGQDDSTRFPGHVPSAEMTRLSVETFQNRRKMEIRLLRFDQNSLNTDAHRANNVGASQRADRGRRPVRGSAGRQCRNSHEFRYEDAASRVTCFEPDLVEVERVRVGSSQGWPRPIQAIMYTSRHSLSRQSVRDRGRIRRGGPPGLPTILGRPGGPPLRNASRIITGRYGKTA
jgi:hypothetical protein